MKTLKQLAQESLDVQNASNLCGVLNGYVKVIQTLRGILPSWDEADKHPIAQVWADKIAHLSGYPQATISEAYNAVYDIVEEKEVA